MVREQPAAREAALNSHADIGCAEEHLCAYRDAELVSADDATKEETIALCEAMKTDNGLEMDCQDLATLYFILGAPSPVSAPTALHWANARHAVPLGDVNSSAKTYWNTAMCKPQPCPAPQPYSSYDRCGGSRDTVRSWFHHVLHLHLLLLRGVLS